MKKRYLIFVTVILTLITGCFLCACQEETPQPIEAEKFTVKYYSSEGGSIEGDWYQTVESGNDCTTVTAVAYLDYVFTGWSDGVETETRTDTNITQDKSVTATFKFHVATVELNYYAGEHGTLTGETHQIVPYEHREGSYVNAIPDEGYRFKIWSDGVTTASRLDGRDGNNVEATAYFERITLEVSYLTDGNGTIDGEAKQTVYYGESTEMVTAIPNEGYRFIGWSDRNKEAQRSDDEVKSECQFTANFEKIINKYYYNLADCYPYRSMELEYGEIDDYLFYVPQREHYTFEGWMLGETKITDGAGHLIVGNQLFDSEDRELRAKWIPDTKYTYKVLIVYITELSGTFQIRSGEESGILDVNYKMSDTERAMCHMTTKQVKRYFDDALDGLVDFQVDEYYTQVPLTKELITGYLDRFSLFANEIPEVSEMLDDYQYIAVSCSIFNYDTLQDDLKKYAKFMPSFCGVAHEKYSYIRWDFAMNAIRGDNITSEDYLDEKTWTYNYNIDKPDPFLRNKRLYLEEYVVEPFMHEFIHTIETWIGTYDFHTALMDGYKNNGVEFQFGQSIKIEKLYLLNKLLIADKSEGIPYEYWKGDVVVVRYLYGENGSVVAVDVSKAGDARNQGVIISGNSRAVIAEPSLGYRFVGWSDGVTTATRCEMNVQTDITVTAYFEPIDFEVQFQAAEGGHIEGETVQYFQIYVQSGTTVRAVADEGYRFVGWSDGRESYFRSYHIDAGNVDLFDEDNRLVLIAIFEKI